MLWDVSKEFTHVVCDFPSGFEFPPWKELTSLSV